MAGAHMIHTAGSHCPRDMTFCRKVDVKKNQEQQLNYSSRQTADHSSHLF